MRLRNGRPLIAAVIVLLLVGAACAERLHWFNLHAAAKADDVFAVRAMLRLGLDPDSQREYGCTPLHTAAMYGRTRIAALLLAAHANPNATDRGGSAPLHGAAWSHYTGVPPCAPAAIASPHDYQDTVELLIAHGAHVDTRDDGGHTPIHLVNHPEPAAALLAHGANPNDPRDPPLCRVLGDWLCEANLKTAKLLVANGAETAAANRDGQTPLHVVVSTVCCESPEEGVGPKAVAFLLSKGAEVNARDKVGYTPLGRLRQHGQRLRSDQDLREMERILLAHGATN